MWGNERPHKLVETDREQIALWDCPDLETLSTHEGKIRVVKAQVSWPADPQKTPGSTWWWMPATGIAGTEARPGQGAGGGPGTLAHRKHRLSPVDHKVALHPRLPPQRSGILALYWLFFAAFNLLSLFLYCQLKSYGRDATDVTRTISRLIDEMLDELPRFAWDTS